MKIECRRGFKADILKMAGPSGVRANLEELQIVKALIIRPFSANPQL